MALTVYAIQNKVNKKLYIGVSENPQSRLKAHLTLLRGGKHSVEDMQDDFNKYGDVFDIFILEENVDYYSLEEYKYMKKYRSCEREYGYNYKDHIAKRINFNKPKEIACKTEAEIIPPFDSEKTEYISAIIEGLNKSNDIEMFNFILQLIHKSEGVINE